LEASEIHGITDEMVKDAPTFASIYKLKFGSPDQTLQDLT
jgi:DNA polymerase III epsilon subunit-like protein